jgi:hypothetical protein
MRADRCTIHVITKLAAQRSYTSFLVTASVLFLISSLFIFAAITRWVLPYDEGLILVGAERVGAGAIVHRDFYANYGPAQFYCIAWLFKWFSPSVLVERAWDAGVRSATTVVCFALILRLRTFQRAIIGYVFALIWLGGLNSPGYPVFPALLFALLSLYCLVLFYQNIARTRSTVGAGMAAGIVALFRYDLGLLVVAAESMVGLAYLWFRLATSPGNGHGSALSLRLLYAAGLMIPTLPVAVWYASTSALSDFWFDVAYFPINFYADAIAAISAAGYGDAFGSPRFRSVSAYRNLGRYSHQPVQAGHADACRDSRHALGNGPTAGFGGRFLRQGCSSRFTPSHGAVDHIIGAIAVRDHSAA